MTISGTTIAYNPSCESTSTIDQTSVLGSIHSENGGTTMTEKKCPFLETTTMTFCKALPVKKMIPLDKTASDKGLCNTVDYTECPAYREIDHTGKKIESVRGFLFHSERYFHPRHSWASTAGENEGLTRVGIDDFSQRLVGRIDRVSLPAVGSFAKGETVSFLLHSGTRTARMVAPGDGVIQAVNPRLLSDPELVNRDPYQDGWICAMRLNGEALRGLFHGSAARKWFEWEVERLQRMFSSDLGITATDGGESLPDISARLNEAQWSRIVNMFLG